MAKGKVRMSNWAAATLKPKQQLYAATDAYASYALATKLYKMLSEENKQNLPLFHVDSGKKLRHEVTENEPEVRIVDKSTKMLESLKNSFMTRAFKCQNSVRI